MKNTLVLIFVALGFSVIARATLAEAPRPNILYFYVDDMGWGSIGPNGQAARREKGLPSVRTPNLDRLAAQGVNFRRGYACTVCSPSRASQQSGFHQGHSFSDRNDPDNAKKAMRADDILMGDAMAAAGYTTGYWGKWGYGGSKDQANPTIDNIQTLPTSHGYQHVLAELHHVRAHTFFQPTLWSAPAAQDAIGGVELIPNSMAGYRNRPEYPAAPALQNHADYPATGYCDDAYAFAALDFVRAQSQSYNASGKPFFGLLAVQIPHAPFAEVATLPEWDQAYEDDLHFAGLAEQSQQWAAMVTRIDAHFGNILAALEDPNHDGDKSDSVADNTLVIFQSDNGGPGGKNNLEFDANGGLTGNKGKIQEGGIRVPLVMRWPKSITETSRLKVGSQSNMVVDITDLLPTFCDLAGVAAPLGIDGVSIAPTLLSDGTQREREFIIHEAGNGQSIIRGNLKLVRSKKAPLTLFDLDADPAEQHDLAEAQPETVKELETLLLGERVAEPRGFATTYHHWTGKDGSDATDAANWSDYEYSNAGITYMTDTGPPKLAWVAKIENAGSAANVARSAGNLQFLALEIRGDTASQSLELGRNVDLTGRNEVRIGARGNLAIDGGIVTSLRWIDVLPDGSISGTGTIAADLYNAGTVDLSNRLMMQGDYSQSASGKLRLATPSASVKIDGDAILSGELQVTETGSETGPWKILSAKRVQGKFTNSKGEVVTASGKRLTIKYSDSDVLLMKN
ncbi:MAG: sulfatase-like hydrolase/transferase [Rubripirellula sp.]